MKVGDLVTMESPDWPDHGDVWGIGLILKIEPDKYAHIFWSKVGASWEPLGDLESMNESR